MSACYDLQTSNECNRLKLMSSFPNAPVLTSILMNVGQRVHRVPETQVAHFFAGTHTCSLKLAK